MGLDSITVPGAGAWGTALANVTARAGRTVTLWGRDPKAAKTMADTDGSPRLPGIKLDKGVTVTADISAAAKTDTVLIMVPAQALREVASKIEDIIPSGTPVIACAKGIERGSHKFMTEI